MVLAALVHSGDIVLSLAGKKLDAAGIDQFAKVGIAEVTEFKHIDRPRDLPLGPLQDLCDLLDVPKGLIVNPANRDEGIQRLQTEVAKRAERIAIALQSLRAASRSGASPCSPIRSAKWRKQLRS